jgi:hypothetical protein
MTVGYNLLSCQHCFWKRNRSSLAQPADKAAGRRLLRDRWAGLVRDHAGRSIQQRRERLARCASERARPAESCDPLYSAVAMGRQANLAPVRGALMKPDTCSRAVDRHSRTRWGARRIQSLQRNQSLLCTSRCNAEPCLKRSRS